MQPHIERRYHELRAADGQVIAKLTFEPTPVIGWSFSEYRRARAEAGSSHWDLSIERKGFWARLGVTATVLIAGSDSGAVPLRMFLMKGTLELDGRRCQWSGGGESGSCAFRDEGGQELVGFDGGSIFVLVNTYVRVHPEAGGAWPLLAVLGLYLRLAANKVFR